MNVRLNSNWRLTLLPTLLTLCACVSGCVSSKPIVKDTPTWHVPPRTQKQVQVENAAQEKARAGLVGWETWLQPSPTPPETSPSP